MSGPGQSLPRSESLRSEPVRLAPVRPEDRAALAALRVAPEQASFVATNAASLAEADEDPGACPRAIIAGERLVGFLMYDATETEGEARLYRFMIDRAEQGRGYGRAALGAALREIEALEHVRTVTICYEPANVAARRMYAAAGFEEEGLDEDGEMIARLAGFRA